LTFSAAFSESAALYNCLTRARRFLDFSAVQTESTRELPNDFAFARRFRKRWTWLVVDQVQDINPVPDLLVREIVGRAAHHAAVGDHRQAIYAFRGDPSRRGIARPPIDLAATA
jgi:DNA helicase-2/ATP-dependent DNA helicase PcrA